MKWSSEALILIMWAIVGLGLVGFAQDTCMITVNRDESIQEAIDAAPEGAVICLEAGEWVEHITIEKNLTLRGQSTERSVIQAIDADRHVVQIRSHEGANPLKYAPHVTIENLTVRGVYGFMVGILIGVRVQAAITDCNIIACGSGISVEDRAQVEISGCLISGNRVVADPAFFGDGVGVGLSGDAQATIRGCTISGNGNEGIVLWDTSTSVITDCTIRGNRFGILLHNSAQGEIERNQIFENLHYGVSLFGAVCFPSVRVERAVFTGYVVGRDNIIPGPNEPHGNVIDKSFCPSHQDPICPEDLCFLTTEEGGQLDRRK